MLPIRYSARSISSYPLARRTAFVLPKASSALFASVPSTSQTTVRARASAEARARVESPRARVVDVVAEGETVDAGVVGRVIVRASREPRIVIKRRCDETKRTRHRRCVWCYWTVRLGRDR